MEKDIKTDLKELKSIFLIPKVLKLWLAVYIAFYAAADIVCYNFKSLKWTVFAKG